MLARSCANHSVLRDLGGSRWRPPPGRGFGTFEVHVGQTDGGVEGEGTYAEGDGAVRLDGHVEGGTYTGNGTMQSTSDVVIVPMTGTVSDSEFVANGEAMSEGDVYLLTVSLEAAAD